MHDADFMYWDQKSHYLAALLHCLFKVDDGIPWTKAVQPTKNRAVWKSFFQNELKNVFGNSSAYGKGNELPARIVALNFMLRSRWSLSFFLLLKMLETFLPYFCRGKIITRSLELNKGKNTVLLSWEHETVQAQPIETLE